MGVLDMLTENLVVRVRLIIYIVLVFFSFFIFVGIAVMKDVLNGCPLYFSRSNLYPAVSNCNYPMAIAIIFQLIYMLFRIVILVLLALGKFTTEMFIFSNILELVYVLIDVAVFILTFIGACILSAGYNQIEGTFPEKVETSSNVAQAGAWISTILWLLVAIIGALYILRAGKVPFMKGAASTTANTGTTTASAPPANSPNYNEPPKY